MKYVPTNLSNSKSKVDKLDVDKVVPVSVNSSKLSDAVKKFVYNVNIKNIEDKIPGITNLATKTSLTAKTNEVKKDIPSITNLVTTTTALNAKTNYVKDKIPNITNLATSTSLSAIENKIPRVSDLFKKSDYSTKISVKLISVKLTLLLIIIMIDTLLLKNLKS